MKIRFAMRRLHREAEARILVLSAILQGEKYGYDISRRTGLRAGRMYPALHQLETEGMIAGAFEPGPEPRRRAYHATMRATY